MRSDCDDPPARVTRRTSHEAAVTTTATRTAAAPTAGGERRESGDTRARSNNIPSRNRNHSNQNKQHTMETADGGGKVRRSSSQDKLCTKSASNISGQSMSTDTSSETVQSSSDAASGTTSHAAPSSCASTLAQTGAAHVPAPTSSHTGSRDSRDSSAALTSMGTASKLLLEQSGDQLLTAESADLLTSSTSSTSGRRNVFRAGQLGAIRLSLMINPTSRELLVTVIEGRDFPMLGSDLPDSHVRVSLCSDQSKSGRRRTRTAKRTRAPSWDETLAPLKIARESVSDEMLRIQVYFESSTSLAGETYLPLDRALRAFPENLNDWFILQPAHSSRRRSGPKWLKRGGETSDMDSSAPFISFLNARLAALKDSPLDTEAKRYFGYRTKYWAEVIPEMSAAQGNDEKLANAMWELFTTETAHLSVLSVLNNPFHRMLQEVKQNKTDTRVKYVLKDCKLDKIFGSVHELMEISLSFVKALESIFVNRAANVREMTAATVPSSPRKSSRSRGNAGDDDDDDGDEDEDQQTQQRVVDSLLDVGAVVDAFAALQERLLEPEMKYRLQHDRARRYIKRTLADEPDGAFALYMQWCQEDTRCGRHSLADLLTQPLQRLTRYPLLLKAILKHTPEDSPNRERLEDQIAYLATAIDEHDRRMRLQDNSNKLRKLQNNLIWPSAMETSANAFVSPVHTAYLGTRKPIDLRTQLHRYEEQSGMTDVIRDHVCDGWLTTMTRAGKEAEQIYVAIVGQLMLMAKPYQQAAQSNGGMRRTISEDKPTLPVSAHRDSSDEDDDDDDGLLQVEAAHHLCEVVVLDVEDQTALVKNCFTLVVMGPFGTPASLLTLKAESAYDKTEWLKHLRNGIDTTDHLRSAVRKPSHSFFVSRDSTSTLGSDMSSRRESTWAAGLRALRSPMERAASRDVFARRRISDAYDEVGPDLPPEAYAYDDAPQHVHHQHHHHHGHHHHGHHQPRRADRKSSRRSHTSPLSSTNSSVRGSQRSRTASARSSRSQRISERANRLSQTGGHITSRDLEESGDLVVPLRRGAGLMRRRGRGRLSDGSDRVSMAHISAELTGAADSGGSSYSILHEEDRQRDSSVLAGNGGIVAGVSDADGGMASQSPSASHARVGARGSMSVRSADAALSLSSPSSATALGRQRNSQQQQQQHEVAGTTAVGAYTDDRAGVDAGRPRLLKRPSSADALRTARSSQSTLASTATSTRHGSTDVAEGGTCGEESDTVHTPQPPLGSASQTAVMGAGSRGDIFFAEDDDMCGNGATAGGVDDHDAAADAGNVTEQRDDEAEEAGDAGHGDNKQARLSSSNNQQHQQQPSAVLVSDGPSTQQPCVPRQDSPASSTAYDQQPVMPAKSHINRLVSRYRKRLSTNMVDKGRAQQQQQQQQQQQPAGHGCALGGQSVSVLPSHAHMSASGQNAVPAAGRDSERMLDMEVAAVMESSAFSVKLAGSHALRKHGRASSPVARPRSATSPNTMRHNSVGSHRFGSSSRNGPALHASRATGAGHGSGSAAVDMSRQRVSSLGMRSSLKTRDSMLLALDGHDNSGTLV
ncbi:hypothetical protein PTSG_12291 [Salpingoeca rosetta]|uniref:DH domain-containing protein n=1 Tax=Salpingoeca rosetta (strain ATCC 50818 / BSB-021) TaxID=946362 RepID=F2UA24_SALR5|nr:uncharacterized protein PTSG_12291 [Salpingoeca rosetta]EGD73599.1 hypothetical protein PTSG_12291 [Salpingoeca rosetta]|eukprot:XP_004993881.1 hypothetical protein PTSG_12291 [Salpingoeca rosetta]